jgi:hypothetical protein
VIRVRLISTPDVITRLQKDLPGLIEGLVQRMNLIIFKLTSKIVGEKIPEFFPNGAPNIAATVRAIPATIQGTTISGAVEAGGPRTTKETQGGLNAGVLVDYAAIQEMGVAHAWKIEPVFFSQAWALTQKKRAMAGTMPKALAFIYHGQLMIRRSVIHPGLVERPYMRTALQESEAQIVADLDAEVGKFLT